MLSPLQEVASAARQGTLLPPSHPDVLLVRRVGEAVLAGMEAEPLDGKPGERLRGLRWEFQVVQGDREGGAERPLYVSPGGQVSPGSPPHSSSIMQARGHKCVTWRLLAHVPVCWIALWARCVWMMLTCELYGAVSGAAPHSVFRCWCARGCWTPSIVTRTPWPSCWHTSWRTWRWGQRQVCTGTLYPRRKTQAEAP